MTTYALIIVNSQGDISYIDSMFDNEDLAWEEAELLQYDLPSNMTATVEPYEVIQKGKEHNA